MKKAIIALSMFCTAALGAAEFNKAAAISHKDLRDAEKELATLEEKIANEKLPLAKKIEELETEVLRMRAESLSMARAASTVESSLINLKDRVDKLGENNVYLSNLLNDYINRWESMIHIGETPKYEDLTNAAKDATEDTDMDEGQKFVKQLAVIEAALDRADDILGGISFEGEALVGENNQKDEGRFAVLGPVAYFASNSGEYAGLAIAEFNAAYARVESNLGEVASTAGISELVTTGSGVVPFDGTLGQALEMTKQTDTVGDEIKKGGMVMYPIVGLLILSILIIIYKTFALMGVKKINQKDLNAILQAIKAGDKNKAASIAKKTSGPAGELLSAAVEHSDNDKEVIEEVLYEVIINNQPKLESLLAFVAVTAATAPLLGLLGTVTGMIKTFKMITVFGTGDASNLADGIGEALLTTKWGLIVAIPTVLCHALLSRMARGVIGSMEQTAVSFINGIVEIRD